MNKIRSWFKGRPRPAAAAPNAGVEAAGQVLREAQARADDTQRLEDITERATGKIAAGVQYWNIGIPRPDPGRNRQEITELKLKVREAGMLAQAVQLEHESDKRILHAAKGLKSIAEGINKTNQERKGVRENIDKVRDELFKNYPPTD